MRRTLGSLLHSADRAYVLACYNQRYTMDHVPTWARKRHTNGKFYAPQYTSDSEWLSNTTFAVKRDGRLDGRFNACQSNGQTWPIGEWLEIHPRDAILRARAA